MINEISSYKALSLDRGQNPTIKRDMAAREMEGIQVALQQIRENHLVTQDDDSFLVRQTKRRKIMPLESSDGEARVQLNESEPLYTSKKTQNKAPIPQTPRKARPNAINEYRRLHQKAQTGAVQIGDQLVSLELFSTKGSYMDVYCPTAENPIILNMTNDQLVIKLYNDRQTYSPSRRLEKFMQSSLDNYQTVQKLGLPIATIYNTMTALEDKFFIQEKIPHAFDLNKSLHIAQLRHFF